MNKEQAIEIVKQLIDRKKEQVAFAKEYNLVDVKKDLQPEIDALEYMIKEMT